MPFLHPLLARVAAGAVAAWVFTAITLEARQPWLELKNCRLAENESNDADSFHVKAEGKSYIFRLYLVDAPETANSGFPGRVEEQAAYFRITVAQTEKLGDLAKKFTSEKLAQPFTVRTRKQEGLGRSKKPRYYAFIQTIEGDLGELLVANGLARVHGTSAGEDGLESPARLQGKLERLEREAKQQKVGAWGVPVGRMMARAAKLSAKSGRDSFDAFFHPERVAAAARSTELEAERPVAPVPPPAPLTNPPSVAQPSVPVGAANDTKLDPNTATAEELMKIKGIGPILAGRIIAARPYKSADELKKAKGVGPKIYAKIRPFFADH